MIQYIHYAKGPKKNLLDIFETRNPFIKIHFHNSKTSQNINVLVISYNM